MNTVIAEIRSPMAKVKKLRKSGIIPCSICGGALSESLSIQIAKSTVQKLLRSKCEGNKIEIELDQKVIPTQIKDVSRDSATSEIQHISFQMLEDDKKVNSRAQIILQNKEVIAGFLEQMLFYVPYSAFPSDMVGAITVDLGDLPVGGCLTVGDLAISKNDNIDLQIGKDRMVLRINDKKRSLSRAEELQDK